MRSQTTRLFLDHAMLENSQYIHVVHGIQKNWRFEASMRRGKWEVIDCEVTSASRLALHPAQKAATQCAFTKHFHPRPSGWPFVLRLFPVLLFRQPGPEARRVRRTMQLSTVSVKSPFNLKQPRQPSHSNAAFHNEWSFHPFRRNYSLVFSVAKRPVNSSNNSNFTDIRV